MLKRDESALTSARIVELYIRPVQGEFDVAHLREVHRRIFQDLPHRGPGEYRPDAPGHFKHRALEATNDRVVVPYALRPEMERNLGATLEALQGGKALKGYDTLEMSEAIAQTYARLDYLHPFGEGNSRTLRTFTEQLARENGHKLDWETTNVSPQSRDALYIARDMAVIQLRNPGITMADAMAATTREEYELKYQLTTQVQRYKNADPLEEVVRRSLERGREQKPYDRRMSITEAAREIVTIEPIAQKQAERNVEDMRLAVLRKKEPAVELDRATNMRDWVAREGTVSVLTDRLANVTSGHITINHEPGASALNRLTAVADGISLELAKQRTNPTPTITPPVRQIDRGDLER
ncbi:Fic family protein [Sphingomonas sp. PAMC 26605]|uniref:Fic family protein n=1 Tax=Sphingomonas sp. PAMC 26605 TaxID=1112214 RepID=UPI00026CD20B|nr:Fic family protein [Sphingomonas sp. PAMC 26605]